MIGCRESCMGATNFLFGWLFQTTNEPQEILSQLTGGVIS